MINEIMPVVLAPMRPLIHKDFKYNNDSIDVDKEEKKEERF